ncbi:MAG: nucleoside hydrolase [Pseudomonadota bacterium]
MVRPILIDCDPGIDDCIALMLALASPEALDVRAIHTVAGNVPVDVCTRNALGVLALAGRSDIPVHAGCPRPMVEAPVFADHVHGPCGLGAAQLPPAQSHAQDAHAVSHLIETLRAAEPASLTLVITGPMTNLAVALIQAPDIAAAIGELVIMGGARAAGGNITASAEFNIYADPHAARIVLACGRPITLIGLDATLQFRCTPQRMSRLEHSGHRAAELAHTMIRHVNAVYGALYGSEGAALHDPCTIGYLLAPELFATCPAAVEVETRAGLTRGHTAIDVYLGDGAQPNIRWATGVDAPALFDLMLDRITRL